MKRRWMPVILACILCVCSYSTAVLAEPAEDNDLQLLIDLGVLKEENKAELDRPVQRIAFVDLFSSIENVQGTAAWIKPGFTDVDLSADYADALAWLYMGGAIADEEYFYPDNNITREEAAKIMVTVLGYGSEAALSGGYPGGYMNTANRLHLLSGVQGSDFTLRSAGKMFLNALEAKTAAVKNGFYEKSETELTMLERFYGVSFSKGIMTKNTLTKLRPAMSDSAETIGVEDEEYVCTSEYDDYIGKSVTVYYRFSPEKENEVVGVYPSKKNRVVQFEVEYDTTFSDFTYEVYMENRVKKYKIGRSADVIYNGRVYTQYQEEELLPDNGNVTLIDSGDDGKFETVMINAYEVYIAGNGTGDGLIYDKLGKEPIDVNGDGDCVIKENGLAADFSKITLGDLLEIRRSRGDAHGLIQIDISRNVVSGALAAIAACGLERLYTVRKTQKYRDTADKMLMTLMNRHSHVHDPDSEVLLEKCYCGGFDEHGTRIVNQWGAIFGDYFYLEALFRRSGFEIDMWRLC